ncbi:MAG: hypothetical protein GY803_02075 [Chloroflexi bacterium]|nr:hypothetical protein [Chloroflexota bacterium]
MSHQSFETPFLEEQFHIEHLLAHVHEGAAPGPILPGEQPLPIGIIRTDQDWTLHVHWHTTGNLVPILRGVWHLDMYLERMGPGPDRHLPVGGFEIPLTPNVSGTAVYNPFIVIPAGTVPAGPDNHPVAYRLVATITYKYDSADSAPFGLMAGFVEGPMVQFYTP